MFQSFKKILLAGGLAMLLVMGGAVAAFGQTFTGTGRGDTDPFTVSSSGPVQFTASHSGTGFFWVDIYEANTQRYVAFVINERGNLSNHQTQRNLEVGTYFLRIVADGAWNITVGTGAANTLNLRIPSTTLPADGTSSTEVSVSGADANQPVVFRTTLGSFEAGTAITEKTQTADSAGRASVTLYAPTVSGTASVTATSGDRRGEASVRFASVAPDNTLFIRMTSNRNRLAANETATITAQLNSSPAEAVPTGTHILFTTDRGRFSNGQKVITLTTTSISGVATVQLRADDEQGYATIMAFSGTARQSLAIWMGPARPHIRLDAQPYAIHAESQSASLITAELYDANGNLHSGRGVNLALTVTGDTGLFHNNANAITVYSTTGKVAVSLFMASPGMADIIAEAHIDGQLITQRISIRSYTPLQTAAILLEVYPPSRWIAADGQSSARITARVFDRAGRLVPDGTAITFTTTLGAFSNGNQRITVDTLQGRVEVALISGLTSGVASVMAESNGVTQQTSVTIGAGGNLLSDMLLESESSEIDANGYDATVITATLIGRTDLPLSPETQVRFETTLGFFANGQKSLITSIHQIDTTTNRAVVTVRLFAGLNPGRAEVRCSSGNIQRVVYVKFNTMRPLPRPGPVSVIQLKAEPPTVPADGVSSTVITATLLAGTDSRFTPVAIGTEAIFTTTLGRFPNGQKSITRRTRGTGEYEQHENGEWFEITPGQIDLTLTADTHSGRAQVTCSVRIAGTSEVVTSTIYVEFHQLEPNMYEIDLVAYPVRIDPDGLTSGAVVAFITEVDSNKAAPAGTVVEFRTNKGRFANGMQEMAVYLSDSTGIVVASLLSDVVSGVARIECYIPRSNDRGAVEVLMQYAQEEPQIVFEQEPNNRASEANPLLPRTIYQGGLNNPYDEDWFAFTLNNSGQIDLYFLGLDAHHHAPVQPGAYAIDVRNEANQVMANYMFFNPLEIHQWPLFLNAGKYYVTVYHPRIGGTLVLYTTSPYYLYVEY